MRLLTIALAACFICRTVVAGDKDIAATQPTTAPNVIADITKGSATQPATRPADIALSVFDKAIQKAASDRELSIKVAARQYKTDLQKALGAAMDTVNLSEANRDKAEIDRIDQGAKIDEVAEASAGSIFTARKKYDQAVKKADEVQAREDNNAKRTCVTRLSELVAAALKEKDLSEANRVKEIEDRLNYAPEQATAQTPAMASGGRDRTGFAGWRWIVNKGTGRYLWITSDNKNPGNVVSAQPANDSDNEKWRLEPIIGYNGVELVNKYSNKVVGVREASQESGKDVIEWNDFQTPVIYDKTAGQNWKIEAVGDSFKLICEISGQCLTNPKDQNTQVNQMPWRGSDDQLWYITPIK